MNLSAQEITAQLFTLPEQEQQEVFDFIQFLKIKSARQQTKRATQDEDAAYLSAVSDTMAEEWNGDADNEAYRDL